MDDRYVVISFEEPEHNDEPDCFARIDRSHCNALTCKECNGCRFYKPRKDIKNNVYYGFSYSDTREHRNEMINKKINPEDVIF